MDWSTTPSYEFAGFEDFHPLFIPHRSHERWLRPDAHQRRAMKPRLNKLVGVCPYFGGLAWLLLMMRSRDFSLKWAVIAYMWPLVGLTVIVPLAAVSSLWGDGGEIGTTFTILLFFIVAGILGEVVIWPLRVIHTVRYDERQPDEAHTGGNRLTNMNVETSVPSGNTAKESAGEIGSPSRSSGAPVGSGGGGFRRALTYVGIGIAAFGAGAAAAEATDQALGGRKGGFQPGKILAAGGQAMLGATAVILFVIFYPFIYLGSAAWHAYLDESVLTLTMHDQRRIQVVYSSFFPEYQLAVLADTRGCIYLFDLPREHLAQVRSWIAWLPGSTMVCLESGASFRAYRALRAVLVWCGTYES
jgi:hypothetical protein